MGEYAATSNREEGIRIVIFGELDGLFDACNFFPSADFRWLPYDGNIQDLRTVFRFYPRLRKHGELYPFPAQSLHDLTHRVQLGDVAVRHNADPFRA